MRKRDSLVRWALCIALVAGMAAPAGLAFAGEAPQNASDSEEGAEGRSLAAPGDALPHEDPTIDSVSDAAGDAGSYGQCTGPVSETTDEQVEEVLLGLSDESDALSLSAIEAASENEHIVELAGSTQYETAAAQALYAFDSSEYAIVASGVQAVDALSASGLAGVLQCPILLCAPDYVPQATADAISELGVRKVIVVGGPAIISDSVVSELGSLSKDGKADRIAGETLFDTQLAIYDYGAKCGGWGTTAFVANGVASFADALSASPLAYRLKAPVFLADSTGLLPLPSARKLIPGGFGHVVVVGGTAVVSEEGWGVYQAAAIMGGGDYGDVTRLAGETMYDTSAAVAEWSVENGYLSWEGAAFATGRVPYDALAGGALQGSEGSVLLLIDEGYSSALDAAVAAHKISPVNSIKFFGGEAVLTPATRIEISRGFGFIGASISYRQYGMTLEEFTDIEFESVRQYHDYTWEQVRESLDPSSTPEGSRGFYQFAVLSEGYSGMTAQQLDDWIDSKVGYSERAYGVRSKLRGTGAYFIEAAKKYGINEVYLVAHAALESAWGCSALAQGTIRGYEGYMNFYGIGAYDIDPSNGGAAMAKKYGWTTPRSAILGAASWISDNFIRPNVASGAVSGPQDTLWKMRWDAQRAEANGGVWHQYATGRTWATGVASVMADFYDIQGLSYDKSGLSFEIPAFS